MLFYRYGLRSGGSGGNKSLANGGGSAKRGSSGTAAASTALSVGEAAAKSNQARVQVRIVVIFLLIFQP